LLALSLVSQCHPVHSYISSDGSCVFERPKKKHEAFNVDISIYQVEKHCPKRDYGAVHKVACKKCGDLANRAPHGSFVFCVGCPNIGHGCQTVKDFIYKEGKIVEADGNSTLALPLPGWNEITDMDSEFAMNQDGLRQSKRDDEDVFSARCELDDAKTPISVGVVRRVDGDCSPCAARDVPILHWECCHNCEEFATEHPELLVTCRGCGQIPLGVSENASATYHLALQAKNRSTEIVESAIDARLDAEMRKGLDDLTCEAFKTSSGIFSGMSGVLKASSAKAIVSGMSGVLKASSAKAMVSGMSGVLETTSAKAIVSGVSGVLETTSAKAIVSGVSGVADSFNRNGCVALDWLQTQTGVTVSPESCTP